MLDPPAAAHGCRRRAGRARIRGHGGRRRRRHSVAAMEGHAMTAAVATLLFGVVIGYFAQRSRMCFVGGIRDFILVRDTALLKGLAAFGVTASVSFLAARLLTGDR